MKSVLMSLASAALIIGSSASASSFDYQAGSQQFPRGVIIERVVSQSDPQQSYALFLPSSYSPDKKWPVLYCFDPVARGNLPVKLFQEAAEKYGYIVAGSYNSRNGPVGTALEAMKAMWADTHARLSIDDRRVYVAGFSGGSRVATLFASICQDCIKGVLGNGAGFHPQVPIGDSTRFWFFGTVGDEDYNYPELMELKVKLDKHDVPNRIVSFKGGHTWAPAELHMEAIEWLEIQGMRTGSRPRDENLINEVFIKRVEKARLFEKRNEMYPAFISYQALAADFRALKDISEVEKSAARLGATKEVKSFIKQERENIQQQQSLVREVVSLAKMLSDDNRRVSALQELRRRIGELKRRSEAVEDTAMGRLMRRTLNQVFAYFFEAGTIEPGKNHRLAITNLELAAEIKPDGAGVFYYLAGAYALQGEKRKALDALQKAVERGFNDAAQIESNKDMDSLRGERQYKMILENIKGKS